MLEQSKRNSYIVSMTIWQPELESDKPRYVAIADAIARDTASGRLTPGSRLPTHRDLADLIGVTVGTVTRAYSEAARRGLISGEVGRGTFVRALPEATAAVSDNGVIDLSVNHPPFSGIETRQLLAETLTAIAGRPNSASGSVAANS